MAIEATALMGVGDLVSEVLRREGVEESPSAPTPRGRFFPGLRLDLGRIMAFGGGVGSYRFPDQLRTSAVAPYNISGIFGELAVDLIFEAFEDQSRREGLPEPTAQSGVRALNVPPDEAGRPPTLLILTPEIETLEQSRLATALVDFDREASARILDRVRRMAEDDAADGFRSQAIRLLDRAQPEDLMALIERIRPQVVISRLPQMERLCAPATSIEVVGERNSSLGIFCRDANGVFGATACYHGTGPVGTPVTVDGVSAQVSLADMIQDTVFIPLPEAVFGSLALVGLGGVRRQRQPAQADPATFDGVISGQVTTRISSHDAGLLRRRATVQLRVQTDPDTNPGDSGCALIDEHDQVLGFAFERTALDDYPQLSDWIWADNALFALNLTPV